MRCPDCENSMAITDWKPSPGLEPKLRQFKCPKCGETVYKISRGFEAQQEVKAQ